jgi:hypothetical protein
MANWKFKHIIKNTDEGYSVTKSTAEKRGDTFNPPTMPTSSGGVHWLTKGSIVGLNAEGLSRHEIGRGDFVGSDNPQDYADEQLILIAQEAIEFYCITDPDLEVEWTGEVHDLAAGESIELTGLQGKRIFIAEDGLVVDNNAKIKHKVLFIKSKDSLLINNAGDTNASFAVFYKA